MADAVGIETFLWLGQATSHYGESAPTALLIGAIPGNFPARGWVMADGRGLLETDVESRRDVCVLGADLARTLFPFGSAVGQQLKFNGINYAIVGVIDGGGSGFGGLQNNFAVIPITTGMGRFGRAWRSLDILVQARDQASSEDTIEQARGILRAARKVPPGKEDDFEIFSNDSLISQFRKVTLAIRITVGVISSIALLAAGIGIMNIMLVSVTERTREIGIRRAVGAKKRNITTQFILEAIMLCEVGGVIGVVLGIIGGNLAALYLELPAKIPFDWAVFGLVMCSVVGIIFGSYPAIKAANLDPIDSLRYE
jgi:putative ABC transport system permease protein